MLKLITFRVLKLITLRVLKLITLRVLKLITYVININFITTYPIERSIYIK